jgi:hypothetical protein
MTEIERAEMNNALDLAQAYIKEGREKDPDTGEGVISLDTLGSLADIGLDMVKGKSITENQCKF